MLGVNGLLCLVHIFLIFQQSMHILGPLTSRGRSWKEMINLGFRAKRKINTTQVGSSAFFSFECLPLGLERRAVAYMPILPWTLKRRVPKTSTFEFYPRKFLLVRA